MTETEKLMWCWIRALYLMLNDDAKKIFAEYLTKELTEWRTYDNLSKN